MHEGASYSNRSKDSAKDSAMDVWNNKVGSEIGKKYSREDKNAPIAIAKEIKQAIDSGILITDFKTDPRVNNFKKEQKNNFDLGVTDNAHDFFKDFGNFFGDMFDEAYNWLPDFFKAWFDLNRNGTHTFYDPLILDLYGNGISTVAIDNKYFDKNVAIISTLAIKKYFQAG